MVVDRVGADNKHTIGIFHRVERRRNGAGADTFEQRCHRRSMAEPGAVIHIVGTESCTYQLLKQVSFFVTAFCRTKSGKCIAAFPIPDPGQSPGGIIQRLFPGSDPEVGQGIGRIQIVIPRLGTPVESDQWPGQTMRMFDIIETEPALDAQSVAVWLVPRGPEQQ